MVLQESEDLNAIFQALADPTRRAMLRELTGGERKISDLAQPFDMSFPAASKHVRVLERAGLLTRRVEGRAHFCSLDPEPLKNAEEWLSFYSKFWNERLDALGAMLDAETETKADSGNA